jgi:hypothetical protein
MHTFVAGEQLARAYTNVARLSTDNVKPAAARELATLQQHISRTYLQADAFARLLANPAVQLSRLEDLLKVIVWEALGTAGIDADAAIPARAGEAGYGWTNGGWLLSQLEPELQHLYRTARNGDRAFARMLERAISQRLGSA